MSQRSVSQSFDRRRFLQHGLAGAAGIALGLRLAPRDVAAQGDACLGADYTPTPATTEGPYYTAGSPERASLIEDGVVGQRLLLTGRVLSTYYRPIGGAWLDFWQADGTGTYDNAGYRLRGHQYATEQGIYALETVLPGEYPGRPEHIHVKVQAPDSAQILTTQVFFPTDLGGGTDNIYQPGLMVTQLPTLSDGTLHVVFDFILAV